jgi:hypothetical protein
MCTLTINQAATVAVPIGNNQIEVTLSGTVANCTSNDITVMIDCRAPSGAGSAVISGNTWTATIRLGCPCGSPVTINATCKDSPPCSASYSTTLTCTCCPTGISTGPICVEYEPSGQALVKFVTMVNVQSGCFPVTVQRDFGDGTMGSPKTYTDLSTPDTEIHIYSASSVGHIYTSIVNVLSPASCTASQTTTVTIDPSPPCATWPLLTAICKVFQFSFLLSGSASIVLFISLLAGCSGNNSSLLQLATGLAISAVILLLLIWAACRKCICRFLLKLLGQLLLVIGVLLSMFIVQPACLQLALGTFTALTWIILITVVVLLFGYFVLHRLWYGQGCCPVTICDFWQAVIFAMTVAFVAALVVFVALPLGVQALGLVLALLLANSIMNFAGIQININQNAQNC